MRISTLLILIALSPNAGFAQGVTEREHPRVAELQDRLTDYARDYLKTRLPDIPFLVSLKIEPLRRQKGSTYEPIAEKLPFYDLEREEIRDEWDDPGASLYVLQSRIQKATVLITLPQALRDEEISEIKDSLTILLRLVPGRDEVRVERRSWSLGNAFWYQSALAVACVALLLVGLLFVSRSWARKLANAIYEIKPKEKEANEMGGAAFGGGFGSSALPKAAANNDVKFNDPIKTREYVSFRVKNLCAIAHFPNLQALIEFDRLAELEPAEFGALMMEFPPEKQAQILSLSYKPSWLNAFAEPGELSGKALDLLERVSRLSYSQHDPDWERLLIQFWRLGSDRLKFLKALTKDEAFALLKHVPTSIAVPVARQVFPGAWGVLLDSAFEPIKLPQARVKELHFQALQIRPLLDTRALDRYRQEKDLIDYLKTATIPEERDVYGALPTDSFLWQVRPPFFVIFDQPPEVLRKLHEMVSLDDWALALFNVSRDFRTPVEEHFNSKQRYLFVQKMKIIEAAGLDRKILGEARERIARAFDASGLRSDVDSAADRPAPESETQNDNTPKAA